MCFFGRRGYQLHLAGRIRSAMVLTKTYKRYALLSAFGIIASSKCNTVLVEKLHGRINEHCVATGANEDVIIWDTRKGEKVMVMKGDKHEATYIAKGTKNKCLAIGYNDGAIKLWDLKDGSNQVTFSGHKSAITSLCFDSVGSRLASGSRNITLLVQFSFLHVLFTRSLKDPGQALFKFAEIFDEDTDVIVWDVLNEHGLFRLKGHKGPVTCCHFLKNKNVLVTSSKDTFVKFWDLDTQHCFLTLVGHRSEVKPYTAVDITHDEVY